MLDYKIKKTFGDCQWFSYDRFGMFIHFGLYSVTGRHEWIKTMEQQTDEQYDKYTKYFYPDLLDAKEWAKYAKEAGMKYAVFTAKHHEGFCMFDSAYTDYKITNTSFGRDVLKEYIEAFRNAGLKVGVYYSIIDWHHPQFPIDGIHPRRNDGELLDKGRDIKVYNEYVRNQLTEILINYGKIDILWFDFATPNPDPVKCLAFDKSHPAPDPLPKSWYQYNGRKGKEEYESERLIAHVRSLQPHIILNDRADVEQDIYTPEQVMPTEWLKDKVSGEYLRWEACHTFSGSWGYSRDEMTWKSPELLIEILIKTVAYGGNLIMNVGPTARGCFDERAINSLKVYEHWMKYNSRSIYGCTMAENKFVAPEGAALTESNDGKRLYIHLITYPFKSLEMKSLLGKIEYAQFLHDGSELLFDETEGTVKIDLPINCVQKPIPVIEIFLK